MSNELEVFYLFEFSIQQLYIAKTYALEFRRNGLAFFFHDFVKVQT